jgi:Mn-containing catalase
MKDTNKNCQTLKSNLMKRTKLNKSQVLELLNENEVVTTNLKTFINRNKKHNLNYDKCHKWLEEQEKKIAKARTQQEIKCQAQKFNMSVKKYEQLHAKAVEILEDFHTGHAMGCYRTLYLNGKVFARAHDLQSYSNSCKWNETYGKVHIVMNKKQLEKCKKNAEFNWVVDGEMLKQSGIKQYHRTYFEKL